VAPAAARLWTGQHELLRRIGIEQTGRWREAGSKESISSSSHKNDPLLTYCDFPNGFCARRGEGGGRYGGELVVGPI
jgi:hypothetical protein